MNIYGQSVSSTAAALYNVLCSLERSSIKTGRIDQRGAYIFASRRKLGEYIERSERTAQRAVNELRQAGLIIVRRIGLHANDRIYIVNSGSGKASSASSASNGRSKAVKNGRSEITIESNNIQDTSIHLDKAPAEAPQMTAKAVDDAKIAEASARIASAAAENLQVEATTDSKKGVTAKKGRPTAKRQRITKAEKEAAKAKYREHLFRKLDMSNSLWLLPELSDEFDRNTSLIDLIAEAVSVKGQQIRVNGAGLTVDQYWNVIQNITPAAIEGLFDRLKAAEALGCIANKRAYTLAAVYNAVQWNGLMKGAQIPTEALYRHMRA